MRVTGFILGVCATACFGSPSVLHAQSPAYRGLFEGSSQPGGASAKSVTAMVSFSGGYDHVDTSSAATLPPLAAAGPFSSVSGDLMFSWNGRRTQFSSVLGSSARYVARDGELVPVGTQAMFSLTSQLTPRTRLTVVQSGSYTPGLFEGLAAARTTPETEPVNTGFDHASSDLHAYSYGTSVTVDRRVGPRTTVQLRGALLQTDYTGSETAHDTKAHNIGGQFLHAVNRGVSVRIGYTRTSASYGEDSQPPYHDVDLGVDYLRPLSRSRRTTLRVNGGLSVLDAPTTTSGGDAVRQYRPLARMVLTHQIGRSWRAAAAYQHAVQFAAGVTSPLAADSMTTDIGGFLGRRADLRLSGSYSSGDVLGPSISTFTSYAGDGRLRLALNRRMAMFAEYVVYHYRFAQTVALPGTAPPVLTRGGVRIGLTLWQPVWRSH